MVSESKELFSIEILLKLYSKSITYLAFWLKRKKES